MITTTLDGRPVRLIPQEGPPTAPGLYLAEYTPLHGMRHTVVRDVFRHCAGSMILGPDETRLEWWARIVFDAPAGSTAGVPPGGSLIRGGATDGEATSQRGEGAGSAEPSTPGREVAHRCPCGEGMEPCPDYRGRLLCDPELDRPAIEVQP